MEFSTLDSSDERSGDFAMMLQSNFAIRERKTVLVTCLMSALGIGAWSNATLAAGPVVVTRCNDLPAGHGVKGISPRIALTNAVDGDIVDMTGLTCSLVTLGSGEIEISAANVKIYGPTDHPLTLDGNNSGRVLYHAGSGQLFISSVNFAHGHTSGSGGCIYSKGTIAAYTIEVTGCHADVNGGGLLSYGPGSSLTASPTFIFHSTISGNSAGQKGGGVYNTTRLSALYSTISQNTASDAGGGVYNQGRDISIGLGTIDGVAYLAGTTLGGNTASQGGGVSGGNVKLLNTLVTGNTATVGGGGGINDQGKYASILGSTIANNIASGGPVATGGGINFVSTGLGGVSLTNSTVSGNFAYKNAGIDATAPDGFALNNSTVAFNTAVAGSSGIAIYGCSMALQSSIVAQNIGASDLSFVTDSCTDVGAQITGNNNIIMSFNHAPADTSMLNPHLTPLGYHGGSTPTHALLANSFAVDHGNNMAALETDQRGSGFTRSAGTTDVGAYERQANDDELFYDGFD
jgi:hypothetical protein